MNSISWAPWEYGLILGTARADGKVTFFTWMSEDTWEQTEFDAHTGGVNAINFAPPTYPTMLHYNQEQNDVMPPRRLVTGGIDNKVKVWTWSEGAKKYEEKSLEGHQDWVRDVAWCSNIGLQHEMVASCSEDKSVIIWKGNKEGWRNVAQLKLNCPVWRVGWSVTGQMLAVSCEDNQVLIYKETMENKWETIQKLD